MILIPVTTNYWVKQAFLVGKDFGSWPAYLLSLIHPTRVCGVISLGVPFFVPDPQRYKLLPEGFYISRWKVNISSFENCAGQRHRVDKRFAQNNLLAISLWTLELVHCFICTVRNPDELRQILVGSTWKPSFATSTFSSLEVKFPLRTRTRRLWI